MGAIGVILIYVAGVAKAIQDRCKINSFPKSWAWWNEKTSWVYKDQMENWITGKQIGWLEWLFHTVLVFVTDGWHFFQMIRQVSLVTGTCLIVVHSNVKWYWIALAILVAFNLTFELVYSYILPWLIKKL